METATIIYKERVLLIEGVILEADPSVGITEPYFESHQVIFNDRVVTDEFEEDEMLEIDDLSMKSYVGKEQSDWEASNM